MRKLAVSLEVGYGETDGREYRTEKSDNILGGANG